MVLSTLTDHKIEALLRCPKTITNPGARWKDFPGCKQKNYEVTSEEGASFEIYLRQNKKISHSFSCGILLRLPSGEAVTLARYNGSCHPHTNPLEGGEKIDFTPHIHRATERYIGIGRKPEHYAVASDAYSDLEGAFDTLLIDCNVSGLGRPTTQLPTIGAWQQTTMGFFDE